MIIDLEKAGSEHPIHGNVCVVGAGAAGISLAIELARRGVNVTLLESGGLQPEPPTQALYQSELSGLRHNGIHSGRCRVLGGTTTQWGGQILELDPENFDVRPWIPGSGWPFSKSVLAPYYSRAIELEGLSTALLDDAAVWNSVKVPEPIFGSSLTPFFTRWCPEPDFTRVFGTKLSESARIAIYLHANVCGIAMNESRNAIAGLRCRTLGGREFSVTASAYVFCLGGIETARVLLQPLENGMCGPWNASGHVGRYFQDHIDSTLIRVFPRNRHQLHRWFDNVYRGKFKYHPKLKLAASEQKRLGCLSIGATFVFQTKKSESLSEIRQAANMLRRGVLGARQAYRLIRRLPDASLILRQAIRLKLQGRAYNPDDEGIFLRVHCEQSPNTRSRITLTSDRDALGMFRARLDWQVGELEIATIRHFATTVGQAFKQGFAEIEPFPDLERGGPGLTSRFDDSNHHMGATRMAVASHEGVVDPNLRLHGVDNGYVCSSSVFPATGFSNPTHTLIALAARLAEHLAGTGNGHMVST